MTELQKSRNTQEFLKCIAQHLSSRSECKGITYRIAIGQWDDAFRIKCQTFQDKEDNSRICFYPNIYVFPDKYHRKDTDKINVVKHVADAHFGILLHNDSSECTFIDATDLIAGVYEYQSSVDNKKRRWVRLESLYNTSEN